MIFAFGQPCTRNRRCWRGIASECKRRSRAAAQRERMPASMPMAHVVSYNPPNARFRRSHPLNSIPADRIHDVITLVAPSGRGQYAKSRPRRLSSQQQQKSANPERVRTLLFWCRRRDLNPHTRNVGTSTSSLRVCRSTTPTLGC